jgi:hypothetical protein
VSTDSPWGKDGLAIGFTIEPSERTRFHVKIKRELPAVIYGLNMQGHRMLIALDLVEDMYKGAIHKPRQAQESEQERMGSGWVVAVGPLVGCTGAPHPVGILCHHPTALLGKHVYFQMWAGKSFRTDTVKDDEFGGSQEHHLVMLTDRDVQAVDDGPPE